MGPERHNRLLKKNLKTTQSAFYNMANNMSTVDFASLYHFQFPDEALEQKTRLTEHIDQMKDPTPVWQAGGVAEEGQSIDDESPLYRGLHHIYQNLHLSGEPFVDAVLEQEQFLTIYRVKRVYCGRLLFRSRPMEDGLKTRNSIVRWRMVC